MDDLWLKIARDNLLDDGEEFAGWLGCSKEGQGIVKEGLRFPGVERSEMLWRGLRKAFLEEYREAIQEEAGRLQAD